AADHGAALASADPTMPDGIYNRDGDNWRPLLAVADLSGGGWPERARRAAVALSRDGAEDGETAGTMLLADLRKMFYEAAPKIDALFTREILSELHNRHDRPWPEYGK